MNDKFIFFDNSAIGMSALGCNKDKIILSISFIVIYSTIALLYRFLI